MLLPDSFPEESPCSDGQNCDKEAVQSGGISHEKHSIRVFFAFAILGAFSLGYLLGLHTNKVVYAQVQDQPPASAKVPADVEEIAPIMTVGSAGIGTVLAGRIATDQIMVQGIDLVKMHENTLNLLRRKGYASLGELQELARNSRAEKILRMKPQEGAQR